MSSQWYEQQRYIILLLILFFPAGLWLMWRYTSWSKRTKVGVASVVGIFAIFALASYEPATTPNNQAVAPQTAPQTATAPPTPVATVQNETNVKPETDVLFEAEITCQEYAESYFKVKDINISYDQSSIKRKQPDGTLLIKANIADSQGALRQEKPLGTMECATNGDGMIVAKFLTY